WKSSCIVLLGQVRPVALRSASASIHCAAPTSRANHVVASYPTCRLQTIEAPYFIPLKPGAAFTHPDSSTPPATSPWRYDGRTTWLTSTIGLVESILGASYVSPPLLP